MSTVHTIISMKLSEGNEAAYLSWLQDDAPVLARVFARVGIHSKVVMMSGSRLLAHYEADTPTAVAEAFQSPEAVAMLTGRLGALLDPEVPPSFYTEELRWTQSVPGPLKRAAIAMSLKPGQEAAYLEWVRNTAKNQFGDLWARYDIALKEVLVNGINVVSYYVIKDPAKILPSFGEPEAIAALQGGLGAMLDIGDSKPPTFYSEVFAWHD